MLSWIAYFPNTLFHTILTRQVLSTHLQYLIRKDCIYIVNYLNKLLKFMHTQSNQYNRCNKKGIQLEGWFDFQNIWVKLWSYRRNLGWIMLHVFGNRIIKLNSCSEVVHYFVVNKKKRKTEKSEKHKNICFLNVCCVMML